MGGLFSIFKHNKSVEVQSSNQAVDVTLKSGNQYLQNVTASGNNNKISIK